jgi:hypothetical protein
MKPYIFLFLSLSLAWSSCYQDCTPQDVKVGNISLMPTTKAFVQQFVGKKVIFKTESGREMVFTTSQSGIIRDTTKLNLKINCNAGFSSNQKSYDFMALEGLEITLQSDSFTLNYKTWLTRDLTKKADTSVLFEAMIFSTYNSKTGCGLTPIAIFSDRGFPARRTDTSDTYRRFRVVPDTLLGTKRLQNVNFRKPEGNLCSSTDVAANNRTPLESFFNFKQGIVAFKTLSSGFYFFDRIE